MSINKWIGLGNITRDPETRYLPNGDAVTNCSIACNEKWTDKSGEKQERVEYVNLVFYKRIAEVAGQYLTKGSQIYVEGKLQTRKWKDKEGHDRYSTEVICHELQMLGGKQTPHETAKADTPKHAHDDYQPKASGSFSPDNFDDDIPF